MKRLITVVFFLSMALNAWCQKASYLTYGREEGLPQSQVRAITSDQDGFLWIGTLGGLSRFDGVSFRNFTEEDGLSDNQINCLVQGTKLWIGTTGALCHLEGQEIHRTPFPESHAATRVLDIAEDEEGKLWLATAGQGVLSFGDSIHSSISGNTLPDNYVRSVAFDSSGKLWIGTRSGIVIRDQGGSVFSPRNPELQALSVSKIRSLKDGSLLISTFGNGVFIVKGKEILNLTAGDGLPGNFIRDFMEMPSGEIWFGSKTGLAVYRDGTLTVVNEKNGLPYDNVKSLGIDREGNLWIGTDGKGLIRKAGKIFEVFSTTEGLSSNLIMSFAKGKGDTMYLGTYDAGISVLTNDTAYVHDLSSELPSNTIWSLLYKENRLIAGTGNGLVISDGEESRILNRENGLPGNRVTALIAFNNHIYAGLEDGLAILDYSGYIKKIVRTAGKVDLRSVRAFAIDGNTLYFGAEGGVWSMGPDRLKKIPSSLHKETPVYCLEIDENGYLWTGTSDGLMVKTNESDSLKYTSFSAESGSRNINFLEGIDDDLLLVGSNNGLDAIDLAIFRENGRLKTKHYGKYEGLTGAETNQNAIYKTDNSVWFGTTAGAVRFSPKLENKSNEPPKIYLSNIRLFLEEVDWLSIADSVSPATGLPVKPILKHAQNYLTFNYSGIYFTNPDKVRYMYMVEGVDENWLGPTESRSATYAYLPHGSYNFKVKAFQVDAPNKTSESGFEFSIKPPFYLTNWFFALVFAVMVGVIYLIYSARLRKEREKQANLRLQLQSKLMQLESQSLNSSMNRHFVFNALNSIQYYINMQDRKSANRYLTSFAKLIRKNLDSSLQTDTSLGDELERLELYLSLEQMRFQDKFEYQISIDPRIDLDSVSLPAMMLQPFLENSIWHGILPSKRKGLIDISISSESDHYVITIDDNGVGIDTSLKKKSNGSKSHVSKGMDITLNRIKLYQNMTGQAYRVNGPFERKNDDGAIMGTRIEIRLPKKPTVPELNGESTWNFEGENVI